MLRRLGLGLGWLVGVGAGVLSLGVVVPPLNQTLLPLAVGAPEISPLLVGINAIALVILLLSRRRWQLIFVFLCFVGLLLSMLPLLQLPAAVWQADQSVRAAFGSSAAGMARSPFSLGQFVRGIPVEPVQVTDDIEFAAPDGVALNLVVYQPAAAGPHPAVVTLYGGGWQSGSPLSQDRFHRQLASWGYTVVAASYRHAPEYTFPAQLEDVRSALAFVRQQAAAYGVDPDRIALMGWSAGAQLVMLAGYQADPPVQAVVSYYGPVDLKQGYADPPQPDPLDVRAVLEAYLGGPPDAVPAAYDAASPINAVRAGLPPTLLVYGRRDHIVKVEFGLRLYEVLQRAENTAVLVEIPWAEHAFDAIFRGVSNQLALRYVEQFLQTTLESEGPVNPAVPG